MFSLDLDDEDRREFDFKYIVFFKKFIVFKKEFLNKDRYIDILLVVLF